MTAEEEQCALWNRLQNAKISEIVRDGQVYRFRLEHQGLASQFQPDFKHFYCNLYACTQFALQPLPNDSTLLTDLPNIEKLSLHVAAARIGATGVLVDCYAGKSKNEMRLRIKAGSMVVWDENFDRVDQVLLGLAE